MYGLKPAPFKTGPLLLNDERPGVEAGSFLIQFHYVNCSKWSVTHLPCWRIFDLVWMVRHGRLLHRLRDLTRFLGGRLCSMIVPAILGAGNGTGFCCRRLGRDPSQSVLYPASCRGGQ